MAQYKHDRFFKFYIQSLYKTKGDTLQNIQVHNDEDLEIDLMFMRQETLEWQQENLGLFDRLMQEHPTIIIEHYSSYLEETDIHKSITRKNLYWTQKEKELLENAKNRLETGRERLSKQAKQQIEHQNPFTWILTVNCSEKLLRLCNVEQANELGVGVYRLPQILRMGIVIIEQLLDNSDTIWLKMLGNKESAQIAFESIKQLSPDRREKNDIISTCVKYCVYLRNISTDNLTSEERDFMRTMEEIDAWYEAQMNKARLEGELEGKIELASTMIRVKFGAEILTPQIVSQLQKLNAKQLDGFMLRMLNWQQPLEIEEWLKSSEKV
ncbi:hypothetical protein NIES4071_85850 [Calothrix sp. NIES-4071]|nr:hypothetical protein NIES4071_85850 [Calothrix sp. NIES-4071]BAZ62852.1 hypothetical protein NIES4105_85780 [Calothrix sp. NIES-4105]